MAVELGTAYVSILPSTSALAPGLATAFKGASASAGAAGTAASQSFGSKLTSGLGTVAKVGGAIIGTAAVIGAGKFVAGAVTLEAEYSKTMAVFKAVTGAPREEMHKLDDLAMKMGADTVFSASDAAQAMLELGKNGISPATIQAGALKEALTLAAAGGVDMSTAAKVMGNTLNAFNLKGKQAGEVAAALAGAANASSADISDLALGLQQASTVAADAGLSVQETTGAIAAFANAGIAGSDAGTSLKTMLARLVPSTAKAADEMDRIHLTTYDGAKAVQILAQDGIKPLGDSFAQTSAAVSDYLVKQGVAEKGTVGLATATDDYIRSSGIMHNDFLKSNGDFKSLGAIAGELQKSFGKMSDSERAAAMNTIFGSDARRAATILANQGAEGLAKYVKATSNAGAADKAAAAQMRGTSGALERMHGSVETAGLAFGKAIKPITIFAAGIVEKIANKAVPIIEDLGKEFKSLLPDADGVGDSLGKLMKNVDVGAIFEKIKKAVQGINWKELKDGFSELWQGVSGASSELPTLNDLISVFSVVLKFVASHMDLLRKALPFLVAGFAAFKVAQLAANVAASASIPIRIAEIFATRAHTKAMRTMSVTLTQATGSTIANTTAETSATTAKSAGVLATLRAKVATIGKTIAEKAARVATLAFVGVQWLLNAALSANPIALIVILIAALVAAVVIAYKKSDTFREIVQKAWAGIQAAIDFAWNKVIKPVLGFLWAGIKKLGAVFGWLWENVIKPVWEKIKTAISFAWNSVIKPIIDIFKQALTGDLGGAFQSLQEIAAKVWAAIIGAIRKVPGLIIGLGGKFLDAGKALIGKLGDGLAAAGGMVADIGKGIVNFVIGKINEIIDTINGALEFSVFGKDIDITDIPQIPTLASGGRATKATLAVIGEGSEPESVLPDSMLKGLLERAAGGKGPATDNRVYIERMDVADHAEFQRRRQGLQRRAALTGAAV